MLWMLVLFVCCFLFSECVGCLLVLFFFVVLFGFSFRFLLFFRASLVFFLFECGFRVWFLIFAYVLVDV